MDKPRGCRAPEPGQFPPYRGSSPAWLEVAGWKRLRHGTLSLLANASGPKHYPRCEPLSGCGQGPGNIRELQNAIERAVALTHFEELVVEDLPETVREYKRTPPLSAGEDPSEILPMHEVGGRYILRVLEAVGGNKTTAARLLGFDRRTNG